MKTNLKYGFAGNRIISYNILKWLIDNSFKPSVLFVSDDSDLSKQMIELSCLEKEFIFTGKEFKRKDAISSMRKMNLDYIFGIHFHELIPKEVLDIPKIGFINIHPAYLPYNKGWHTPSWAILNKSKYGATIHFMSKDLDEGDIINQKEIEILVSDTAHSLYQRVLCLEEELFKETFPFLISRTPNRIKQDETIGDIHFKKDLKKIQKIDMNEMVTFENAINKFRAFTTNDISEAAFFIKDGNSYAVQIKIEKAEFNN
jgi:methionyl-tRNA formyltransferase